MKRAWAELPKPSAGVVDDGAAGASKSDDALAGADEGRAGLGFKVMTWNVLADGLADEAHFHAAPAGSLEWASGRGRRIAGVVAASGADVLCLQEVNHFEELQEALGPLGYEGFFAAKSRSPATKFGKPKDGCAVFVRSARFAAVSVQRVPYKGFTQVFQVAHLRPRVRTGDGEGAGDDEGRAGGAAGGDLVVFNTHLKAKEPMEPIRLRQMEQLLAAVQAQAAAHPGVAVVCAGDFNSKHTGPAYRQMTSALVDSHASVDKDRHFTTWFINGYSGEERKTIDYIFHNDHLAPTGLLAAPLDEDVPDCRFPNDVWPSDHLCVVTSFVPCSPRSLEPS